MIETISLTKKFDDIVALDSVSATIREGQVFGLIGTNGAGKSTFLRCLSGIYKPDGGEVRIDGGEVFEHVSVKSRFFFISDELVVAIAVLEFAMPTGAMVPAFVASHKGDALLASEHTVISAVLSFVYLPLIITIMTLLPLA